MTPEFKVGDKVKAFGRNGVVKVLYLERGRLLVEFDNSYASNFCLDGRFETWHLKPSLKHRRFKKSGKIREIWVNFYEDNDFRSHISFASANATALPQVVERAVRFIRAKDQKK